MTAKGLRHFEQIKNVATPYIITLLLLDKKLLMSFYRHDDTSTDRQQTQTLHAGLCQVEATPPEWREQAAKQKDRALIDKSCIR